MIACKQKPRWVAQVYKKLLILSSIALLMCVGATPVNAEVDISLIDSNRISIAGKNGGKFYFGEAELSGQVMLVPLRGWVRIRGAGNGTGSPNGAGNGTGDQTNGAGNGTGGQTNGAGNGTGGRREIAANWGVAAIALGCNQAVVAVLRLNDAGLLVEEEFSFLDTDFCVE